MAPDDREYKPVGEETGRREEQLNQKRGNSAEKGWLAEYKYSVKSIDELSPIFIPNDAHRQILKQVTKTYHMRIPRYFLSLIKDSSDYNDPIRRQCIPSPEEINEQPDENIDPLAEEKTSPHPYLVHRYPDRVLLLVASRCFMYCRHCTRKRLWKNKIADPTLKEIDHALNYVKQNKTIREVIISGGDPLTMSDERLDYVLSSVSNIEHIQNIRIGTRAPVVFPQRIDSSLCKMLQKYPTLWINVQFNHPKEITPASTEACRKLQKCAIPLSNQSVLLKGINDDAQTMIELCHKLQGIRVRPYYLFQCDPVVGTSHFRTPVVKGMEIMEAMHGYTGGMCIPSFIVDGTEGKGKVHLNPNCLVSVSGDGVSLRNYKNEIFTYKNPK